jgi:hypothetical protein
VDGCKRRAPEASSAYRIKDVFSTFPLKVTIQRVRSLVAQKVVTLIGSVMNGSLVRQGLLGSPSNGTFSCPVRGEPRLVGCPPTVPMSTCRRWGR